jgi:hypothetical protein
MRSVLESLTNLARSGRIGACASVDLCAHANPRQRFGAQGAVVRSESVAFEVRTFCTFALVLCPPSVRHYVELRQVAASAAASATLFCFQCQRGESGGRRPDRCAARFPQFRSRPKPGCFFYRSAHPIGARGTTTHARKLTGACSHAGAGQTTTTRSWAAGGRANGGTRPVRVAAAPRGVGRAAGPSCPALVLNGQLHFARSPDSPNFGGVPSRGPGVRAW